MGFTSNGWLKAVIKPQLDPFPNYSWICEGLFVATGAPMPLCKFLTNERFCAHCPAGGSAGLPVWCAANPSVTCLQAINVSRGAGARWAAPAGLTVLQQ